MEVLEVYQLLVECQELELEVEVEEAVLTQEILVEQAAVEQAFLD